MSYQDELIQCYDSQANHFHHTRGFHKRPELEYIKPHLLGLLEKSGSPSLLDLGCGSGRISGWLAQEALGFDYTGVDYSSGMIEVGKSTYPTAGLHCADMITYMQEQPQQSVDCILSLAAFHHLETDKERLLLLHNLYRALEYGGTVILINWSYSDRFIKKYKHACIMAIGKSLLTLGKLKWNDILVPRKDPQYQQNNITYKRYYHLFTLSELRRLISLTNFTIEEITFIDQQGNSSGSRANSRNSICILKK